MRKLIYRLFLRVIPAYSFALTAKDTEKMEDWLALNHENDGFRTYFISRDYALLKEMGQGVDEKRYLSLVGRRMELLQLLGEAKRAWEKEDSKKAKKK